MTNQSGVSSESDDPNAQTWPRFTDGHAAPTGLVLNRYELGEAIGRGRLGAIYAARDVTGPISGAARQVAIQVLEPQLAANEDFVENIGRGYAALQAASHPNVVRLLDFGWSRAKYVLVMELLEGVSLRFVLDEEKALPLDETKAVVRAVGDALQYLHAKSMVHGRLTAENVFVTYDYGVKVLDLVPLMPATPIRRRHGRAALGTAGSVDVRDDVFGLACLTYELLSGRHPFNFNSAADARRAGLEPARIESLAPAEWQALKHGLALVDSERPSTVSDWLRELGVTGKERLSAVDRPEPVASLRAGFAEPDRPEPAASLSAGFAEPDRSQPAASLRPGLAEPGDLVDRSQWSAQRSRRNAARRGLLPWVAGFVLVAGVGAAWIYDDALRQGATALVASVGTRLERGSDEPTGGPADASVAPPRVAGSDVAATSDDPEASPSSPVATGPGARRGTTEDGVPPGAADGTDAEAAQSADAAAAGRQVPDPAQARSAQADPAAADALRAPERSRDEQTASAETSAPDARKVPTSAIELTGSRVVVSEGRGAARITVRRSGSVTEPLSFVWWTSDETAVAGSDYARVAEQQERFVAGERSRTLYLPIVDDTHAEPPETLHVYFGRYDESREGRLERLASIRVDIADDD